ncbi:aluminum-activated malate transporter 12-like isoform X1 [Diospyros lotus]|uniref:aluminum-activated malate transporter 12-like isoform X1 n=1 Tax=Diospyros lotus TaxID=55363 RepID=UPI0022512A18|nr:aluminum-activated malate transporter 12-like isoform X1 [Diospyros lotus]
MAHPTKGKKAQISCKKIQGLPGLTWKTIGKVGKEDPRRVVHSLKVGLSLTLVSLLYLIQPLFKGIGQNAIWAVMTVVVVLEFTAGATLCKGLNRGLGTILAGALAFLIEYVTEESGRVSGAVFIGAAVFLIGTASTYARFIPYIRKNYDYGVLVFLLTFNLITVSSYRVDDILKLARERFYTIAIGCTICLFMTLLVFPNWSGEDLHNSTVSKLQGLAKSIQGCVNEYFNNEEIEESKEGEYSEDPIYKGYKAVLDSKSTDETLATHASWEPRRSRNCSFPWQQYVRVGAAIRHFAYAVVALHGSLQTEIQTPRAVRALFKDPCMRLAAEASKALLALAESIRTRRHSSTEAISHRLHEALQDLNAALKSQPRLLLGPTAASVSLQQSPRTPTATQHNESASPSQSTPKLIIKANKRAAEKALRPTLSKIASSGLEFSEALPFAAFASLLVEAVVRLDLVMEEVEELGRVASFRELKPGDEEEVEVVVVTTERPGMDNDGILQNNLASHGAE